MLLGKVFLGFCSCCWVLFVNCSARWKGAVCVLNKLSPFRLGEIGKNPGEHGEDGGGVLIGDSEWIEGDGE